MTCAQSVQVIVLHGWASISPPELIPPPSPGQDFAGTEDSGEDFSGTGHGPFRALIVSRVKCGADLVEATQCYRVWEIRYAFNTPFIKNCGGFDIGLPETRSGRDRVLPI